MNEFEAQFNGINLANFVMFSKLIQEVAAMKGGDTESWLDDFKNRCAAQIADAKTGSGTKQSGAVVDIATSVVDNAVKLASHHISQQEM
ncbi:hypothetical protein [Rhizobium sp. LCM 4573]|uniref:hypothetical protein n=1 Tax=Rhizobium sp. LCM 4573 TaxID=1848291 RepID=UPI0008DB16B2|nr:hypothetical protein [Rhizobium sp. LCM 4573]OHV84151.1 hypothetical protein LCM4573_00095 [Rhizobium sp. LCM 4573]